MHPNFNRIQKKCASFQLPIKQHNNPKNKAPKQEIRQQHFSKQNSMKSTQLKKTHVEDILKESEGETSEDELIEITKIIPQKVNHMDNRQTVITAKKINSDSKTIYSTLHEDMKKCQSESCVPEYFVDILKYMIEKQGRQEWFSEQKKKGWKQIIKNQKISLQKQKQNSNILLRRIGIKDQTTLNTSSKVEDKQVRVQKIKWSQYYDRFAIVIDGMLQILLLSNLKKSTYAVCYFFYMLLISNDQSLFNLKNSDTLFDDQLSYEVMCSLFVGTKYHDIYPVSLEDIVQNINEYAQISKIYRLEKLIYQLNDFTQFYQDTQQSFLSIFLTISKWQQKHAKYCYFMLQSGLNNPQLYEQRPSFKANAIIALYQSKKFKSTLTTQIIRQITGITIMKEKEIRKKYFQSIQYNKANLLLTQRKKYYSDNFI